MNCKILYNPNTDIKRFSFDKAYKLLKKKDYVPEFIESLYPGHVINLINDCNKENNLVLTLGGDGTRLEAIKGLCQLPKQFMQYGHIPAGTTNDASLNSGLPRDKPLLSLSLLLDGSEKETDIPTVNTNPIGYVSMVGDKTNFTSKANPFLKKHIKSLAYLLASTVEMIKPLENYDVTYKVNGKTIEETIALAIISNSYGMARIKFTGNIYDNVNLNDGLFEVIVVKSLSPKLFSSLVKSFQSGKLVIDKYLDYINLYQTNEFNITFNDNPTRPVTIDGDEAFYMKDDKTLHYECSKKLKILTA